MIPMFFPERKCSFQVKRLTAMWFSILVLVVSSFAQPKPVTAKAPVESNFIMCEVMPGAEVTSKVPFTLPFKSVEAWPVAGVKTGCRYIFKSSDEEAAVAIGLTDLGSIKNAVTSFKNARQANKDLWDADPAGVIVLQDTGYFAGKDECGMKFHLGKYILDINFKGQFPDVSDEQKKESGIVLATLVIERLRYLWKSN